MTANLPYQHAIEPLTDHSSGKELYETYASMLSQFKFQRFDPHNMILTDKWMMVIPRRKAWIDEIAANAAAMIGMVWCNSQAQFDGWARRGIPNVLMEMGVPRKSQDRCCENGYL